MSLIAGVDEVGRGPLAGPVVAAAVILDPSKPPLVGLKDSKKLTPLSREKLSARIQQEALCTAIAWASPEEIDSLNILAASLLVMRRAVLALTHAPSHLQIDGPHAPVFRPECLASVETIIGGDALIPAISAASIIAKVYRDKLMTEEALQYPEYGFDIHKGYPTALHRARLALHGPCPLHRKSFKPVSLYLS